MNQWPKDHLDWTNGQTNQLNNSVWLEIFGLNHRVGYEAPSRYHETYPVAPNLLVRWFISLVPLEDCVLVLKPMVKIQVIDTYL